MSVLMINAKSHTDPPELRRGGKFTGIHSEALLFEKKGGGGTVNRVK